MKQGSRIRRVDNHCGKPCDNRTELAPLLVGGHVADGQGVQGVGDRRQGETVRIANDVDERRRFRAREIAFDGDGDVRALELLEACPGPDEPRGGDTHGDWRRGNPARPRRPP